jgi:histidyl-tRNA synthetase
MGDVVLGELIDEIPAARAQLEKATASQRDLDIYVVIAKEERRPDALGQVQALREAGYRVDYPLATAKVGKQFQTAEQLGARVALLFGDEWPQVKVKNLGTGEQTLVAHEEVAATITALFSA